MLVLSLFPGIGLLDLAFEQEGFCVVRGPDPLWGGDIRTFHPPAGRFDGVIGGPPCQAFSRLTRLVRHNARREPEKYKIAENLIPEFNRCIDEAQPNWFLMENVPDVPVENWPAPAGYGVSPLLLNNRWLPGATAQNRDRRFWFGLRGAIAELSHYIEVSLFEPIEWQPAVVASKPIARPVRLNGGGKPKGGPRWTGGGFSTRRVGESLILQGLDPNFFEKSPLTVKGQQRAIGEGVPLPMGRAIARAVREALAVEGL